MRRKPFTRAEKKLLALGISISLFFGGMGSLYVYNNRIPTPVIPQRIPPKNNAYDVYQAAVKTYVGPVMVPRAPDINLAQWNHTHPPLYSAAYDKLYPLATKRIFLTQNAQTLSHIKKGLSYDFLYQPEINSHPYQDYARYFDLLNLKVVEAHSYAQSGDWDGAAETLLEATRFTYQIAYGTPLYGFRASISMRRRLEREFSAILPRLSSQKSISVAHKLDEWQHSEVTYEQVLKEEKRIRQTGLLKLIRSGDLRAGLVGSSDPMEWATESDQEILMQMNQLPRLLQFRLAWCNKSALLDKLTRNMDMEIDRARAPYSLDHLQSNPVPDDRMALLTFVDYAQGRQYWCRAKATGLLLQTRFALHAHYMEHARYPRTLKELTPRFMPNIPRDPFLSSEPLRYRLAPTRYIKRSGVASVPGQGLLEGREFQVRSWPDYDWMPYTLYSVGLNMRDDGGVPYRNERDDDNVRYKIDFRLPYSTKADIVAGINS